MKRLKPKDVATWRAARLLEQGGYCSLCGIELDASEAVADHKHNGEGGGKMRGVLHRGCNAWLGKVENSIKLNKLEDKIHLLVAGRVLEYMQSTLDVYHPTFRTEEEKRIRRNKKARARNANKSKRA